MASWQKELPTGDKCQYKTIRQNVDVLGKTESLLLGGSFNLIILSRFLCIFASRINIFASKELNPSTIQVLCDLPYAETFSKLVFEHYQ